VQLGFGFLLNFADLTAGMILFHLATVDPAWIKAQPLAQGATLYYDGRCALCHGFVRFLLAEDRSGQLAFAPIQGVRYREQFGLGDPAGGLDSIVLVGGTVLKKSAAAARCLEALGGYWRPFGLGIGVLPPVLCDKGYDLVGAVRYRLFGSTDALGRILPPQLRERVLP
jgi:predicted DCC family thiol-disulfide oxidoreductase YuxK